MSGVSINNRPSAVGRIAVLVGAAIMVAPLLWTLLLSLKSNSELMRATGTAFHAPWTLENYRAILGS